MATTIEVNKSSIKELLITGTKEKFLIPEYQRPYRPDEGRRYGNKDRNSTGYHYPFLS